MTALFKKNQITLTPLTILAILATISMLYSMYQMLWIGVYGDAFAYQMAKFLFSKGLVAFFLGAEEYSEAKRVLFAFNSGKKGKHAMWIGLAIMVSSLTTYCMIMLG